MHHRTRHHRQNSMREIFYLGLVGLVLLFSLPAMAEVGDFGVGDGLFDTDTDNLTTSGGQVDAAGGGDFVGGMLVDPGSIGTNDALQGDGEGRKEKTEDALSRGAEGVAAAIAAGTALTASGVARLPWPTTPQGVALIALGALEFAQAGATAGVNSQNTSGRNTLNQGTETGSQAQSQQQVADTIRQQIDTPELQQALAENGVNSDDFVNRLASGELRSFDDIMQAVNSPNDFTPEQIAEGQAFAANFAGGVVGVPETNGTTEVARIKPDDSQKKQDGDQHRGGGGGGIVAGAASNASQLAEENQKKLDEAKKMVAEAERLADAELAKLRRAGVGAGVSRDALVRKYLAHLKNKKKRDPLRNLSRSQLAELGIKKLRKRQCIFDVGRRTYLTYANWRKKAKAKDRRERLRQLRSRVARRAAVSGK